MEVSDVAFAYGSNVVLRSVGFSANSGEFVALLGLNGAGKSTMLDILAGLRRQTPVRSTSMDAS